MLTSHDAADLAMIELAGRMLQPAISCSPAGTPLAACRARKLTDEQRSSLAAYLSVYRGTEAGTARLGLSQVSGSNHPSLERALRMLSAAWTEVLP